MHSKSTINIKKTNTIANHIGRILTSPWWTMRFWGQSLGSSASQSAPQTPRYLNSSEIQSLTIEWRASYTGHFHSPDSLECLMPFRNSSPDSRTRFSSFTTKHHESKFDRFSIIELLLWHAFYLVGVCGLESLAILSQYGIHTMDGQESRSDRRKPLKAILLLFKTDLQNDIQIAQRTVQCTVQRYGKPDTHCAHYAISSDIVSA